MELGIIVGITSVYLEERDGIIMCVSIINVGKC